MNQDRAEHIDAAATARQLIADTPGSDVMPPDEREHLQQTIERIITRARGAQCLAPQQRPWATSYRAQTGRHTRREDGTSSEGEEQAS